jgi:hypothetical protein
VQKSIAYDKVLKQINSTRKKVTFKKNVSITCFQGIEELNV